MYSLVTFSRCQTVYQLRVFLPGPTCVWLDGFCIEKIL